MLSKPFVIDYLIFFIIHKLNIIGANFKQMAVIKIESCIGFHFFSPVYVSFHCSPLYVDPSIREGVKPLLTTNYFPLKIQPTIGVLIYGNKRY